MGLFGIRLPKEKKDRWLESDSQGLPIYDWTIRPEMPVAKRKQKRSRKRWLWPVLACLLIVLVVLAIFPGQFVIRQWFPSLGTSHVNLQHALNPETKVVHSSGVDRMVSLFMQDMLRKKWTALWPMLDPTAQSLWQNEQDFTHFEQAKFGQLSLQSYAAGREIVSKPWLDPDTTQVYPEATTVQVALRASAPPGLLTAPSEQELNQGLFQHTLFAVVRNNRGTWKVMVEGPADLEAPVLVPAHPQISHLIIPIFMYHHVSSLPTHNGLDYSLTVTTTDFAAQLTWLQQQGYHAITMTDLFDAFYDGKALPSKPMILTFDDGYADIYTYALPLLLEHHYRGVFYIITGMIGGNYVTWNDVRALANSGMQIASHTVHHVNIGQPPAYTSTQKELVDSKAKLEAELNEPIQFFCYPTGEPFHHDTVSEQQIVVHDLFADGYLGATLDSSVFNSALQNSQTPYQLPRIRVSGGETLEEFVGILASTERADAYRLNLLEK